MAIFQGFTPVATSFIYNEYKYRAKVNGAGFSVEDVIVKKDKVNEATGAVVSSTYFNVTTQTDITATPPAVTDLHAYDGYRIVLRTEQLAFDENAAVSLSAIPAEADHAEVHVWDLTGDVNNIALLTIDGSTPSFGSHIGFRQADGQTFELESIDEIRNLQAIASLGTMELHVVYFYQAKRNA